MGNSHARFVDDAEAVAPRVKTASAQPAAPPRQTAEIPPEQLEGTSPHGRYGNRAVGSAPSADDDRLTGDTSLVEEQGDSQPGEKKRSALPPEEFSGQTFEIASGVPWGEVVHVSDEASQKRFHYRRVFNLVALVAAVVAGFVLFAGGVVATFLAVERRPVLAMTYSPVIRVAFEPDLTPVQKTLVKYEWREVLCRKGILNCGHEPKNRLWDEAEYAPFPPGYPRN